MILWVIDDPSEGGVESLDLDLPGWQEAASSSRRPPTRGKEPTTTWMERSESQKLGQVKESETMGESNVFEEDAGDVGGCNVSMAYHGRLN